MNLVSFDLNLLRVLDALLREQSTVRAGERIGLSQPAVSAALGRLRAALNDPLFIRRGNRLEPTDYARALALPLRDILDQLGTLLSGPAEFDPTESVQTFRISGNDFFADLLMPQLAAELQRVAPGIRVQLVDLVPDDYIQTLERYGVDIALAPRMEVPDWVGQRPVFHASFVMIARTGHPRLARAGIGPGDIVPIDLFCDLGHVLMSPEGKLQTIGDRALARVGRRRRVAMTMPFFSGVCRAVAESDLVALIPRQLAHRLAPVLGLEIFHAPVPVDPALLCMIWHHRSTGNPAHRWLRDLVADMLLPLNEGEDPLPKA